MSDRGGKRSSHQTRLSGHSRLPAVDEVLRSGAGLILAARFGHATAVNAIRHTLAQLREGGQNGAAVFPEADLLAAAALCFAEAQDAPAIRPVFNLTGTVLHTNLGRAVLAEAAIEAAVAAMRQPVALEFDLAAGGRGERDAPLANLIRELPARKTPASSTTTPQRYCSRSTPWRLARTL